MKVESKLATSQSKPPIVRSFHIQPSTLNSAAPPPYHGRLAPSPTGFLHLGHARTFWIAARRARAAGGRLTLRNDDLDRARCRPEFVAAMEEDLRWLGLNWDGAMISQSERIPRYRVALERLHAAGLIFPCSHSRRDVLEAAGAPHEQWEGLCAPIKAPSAERQRVKPLPQPPADDEPVYPREFRPAPNVPLPPLEEKVSVNWRFRVPDGEAVEYHDERLGPQVAIAGDAFGDFLVWRKDDTPSYQLATVVDDAELGVTEVVRGADLVQSTFRQLLLFRALGWRPPRFYHAPLLLDERGQRLAKRHDALAIRSLRQAGLKPEDVLQRFTTSDFRADSG